jgi:hypothetical protein
MNPEEDEPQSGMPDHRFLSFARLAVTKTAQLHMEMDHKIQYSPHSILIPALQIFVFIQARRTTVRSKPS